MQKAMLRTLAGRGRYNYATDFWAFVDFKVFGLLVSGAGLFYQHRELQHKSNELLHKAAELQQKNTALQQKNMELQQNNVELQMKSTELARYTDITKINTDVAVRVQSLLREAYQPILPQPSIDRELDLLAKISPAAGGYYGPSNSGKTIGIQMALRNKPGVIYWTFRSGPLAGLQRALRCDLTQENQAQAKDSNRVLTLLDILVEEARKYAAPGMYTTLILDDIHDCPQAIIPDILSRLHEPHRNGFMRLIFLLSDTTVYDDLRAVSGYSTLDLQLYPEAPPRASLVRQLHNYRPDISEADWATLYTLANGQLGPLMLRAMHDTLDEMLFALNNYASPARSARRWLLAHKDAPAMKAIVAQVVAGTFAWETATTRELQLVAEMERNKILSRKVVNGEAYPVLYWPLMADLQ